MNSEPRRHLRVSRVWAHTTNTPASYSTSSLLLQSVAFSSTFKHYMTARLTRIPRVARTTPTKSYNLVVCSGELHMRYKKDDMSRATSHSTDGDEDDDE